MAVLLLAILMAIMLPAISRAKDRAKFVRWFAFNRQCANDPANIVNFNFQEGTGNTLNNICAGADVENFKAYEYDGHLMKNNSTSTTVNNFQWIKSGGRWAKYGYKYALQFNGVDTYILIPGTQGLDFSPFDDFTVLCWVKFDKLGLGDCPFSKSLWGTETDAACQYDMYSNPYAGTYGQGSFDVDVFTTCGTWLDTHVNFNKANWVQLGLRYKHTGLDASGDPTGQITSFINGQALGDFLNTTSENPSTASATGWKACSGSGLNVPLVLGAAGCYRKYWSPATYDKTKVGVLSNELILKFFFKGRMDEFLLYKRALSDNEIIGHYEMGKE
ncbi:MAG: hypothetical protein A2X48_12585 [Lentisphaerae bacterium GWF2_49_21]|nr:MAG: hypothetical protein A2X48_12585 [Lentisphaerae bacterium GWF2_49_21]